MPACTFLTTPAKHLQVSLNNKYESAILIFSSVSWFWLIEFLHHEMRSMNPTDLSQSARAVSIVLSFVAGYGFTWPLCLCQVTSEAPCFRLHEALLGLWEYKARGSSLDRASGRMKSLCAMVLSEPHPPFLQCSLSEVAIIQEQREWGLWDVKVCLKTYRVLFGDHDFKDVEFAHKCHFDTMLT